VKDWRAHDLHAPPSGYQWVQVNGDFVLAAIATGVISSIIVSSH
jgi:Ni/Co efflux regulator RcnB